MTVNHATSKLIITANPLLKTARIRLFKRKWYQMSWLQLSRYVGTIFLEFMGICIPVCNKIFVLEDSLRLEAHTNLNGHVGSLQCVQAGDHRTQNPQGQVVCKQRSWSASVTWGKSLVCISGIGHLFRYVSMPCMWVLTWAAFCNPFCDTRTFHGQFAFGSTGTLF